MSLEYLELCHGVQKETITLATHYHLRSENHSCLQDWKGPFEYLSH